jgi:ribosomal protein L11 methyltransferase
MESLVISVTVPSCQEDDLVGFFHEMGSIGVEVQNFNADQVTLCAFFPRHLTPSLASLLDLVAIRLSETSRASLTWTWAPHEDWSKHWQDSLHPFSVGASFLVVPGASGEEPEAGPRKKIRIEPGMAFGTGTHESTQLCLRSLEQLPIQGRTVLDVGTGSGILAIAAVHHGARRVFACDTDPVAIQVASANLSLNQASAKVRVWIGSLDSLRDECAQICLANLTAGILERLWPEFNRVVEPRGWLICSGILEEQVETLQNHLQQHQFSPERKETTNGWVCLTIRKRSVR